MKKLNFKIWIGALIFLGVLIGFRAITSNAQTADTSRYSNVCSDNSAYSDPDLTTSQVMDLYHENINKKLNAYIKTMIREETAAANYGGSYENGNPPADGNCNSLNYSTFCVAKTLLSDPNIGYMAYRKALDCRRGVLYESVAEKENAGSQLAAALMVSSRLDAITREKNDAKSALDQTLSAYNELRTAWPMHKKFMKIYDSLIKFRDKMVEIRQQVEEFPAKFIDATTTKCT